METQPRCIPRYFCNKVERICAIYLISTLADCTLPLWKNDIFTLSFSLRECRNTMYFHTSIALVVIEGSCCRKSKHKKSRTISHIWEIPLTYFETAVRSCPLHHKLYLCSFAVRILFCVYDRYMAIIDEKLCTYVSIAASLTRIFIKAKRSLERN